jgi:iron uptake system component EfeO
MNRPLLALLALVALTVAGCSENSPDTEGAGTIAVTSSADECIVEPAEAPAGTIVFNVSNTGDQVTEFYLLGEDEETIIGEVENIGPGIDRDLVVDAAAGTYFTACKPGMTGDGIRAEFTVTGSGDAAEGKPFQDELTAAAAAHQDSVS